MTFTDYFTPCPTCGGTLTYRVFDNGRECPHTGRWQGETQYKYSCNVCQSEGDWRRVKGNAIATMAPKKERVLT